MSDDKTAERPTEPAGITPAGTIICPWCSTEAPAGTERCASCGAALVSKGDAAVPGLTAIDTESLLRGQSLARKRTTSILPFRLSGTTDGDKIEVPSEAELESLAPPTSEVQMEIVRLELDAERLRLENARAALESEAAEAARDAEGPSASVDAQAEPADLAPIEESAVEPAAGPEAEAHEGDQPAG